MMTYDDAADRADEADENREHFVVPTVQKGHLCNFEAAKQANRAQTKINRVQKPGARRLPSSPYLSR